MEQFDVTVIGGGPGGYVAAIRAAQLGLKTACIDDWTNKDGTASLGGTCLNVGCIPSKALLDTSHQYEHLQHLEDHGITVAGVTLDVARMIARKDAVVAKLTGGIALLFKTHKVTSLLGRGRFVRREGDRWILAVGDTEVSTKTVILATGSVPRTLPLAPFDGDRIVDNAGALSFQAVPQRLGVIGAGVIGLELGSVWRRLGSQVTVLEAMPDFLAAADPAIAREALRQLTKQGLDLHMGVAIDSVETTKQGVTVTYREKDAAQTLEVDKLIVAIGRVPTTAGLNGEGVGLAVDARGFITVDAHLKSNLSDVYAIGDVAGGAMLAHKAEEEGIAVAERIAGQAGHVNYATIPWVLYTDPEIAWVGKTETQLKAEGIAYRTGFASFAVNGRALGHDSSPVGQVRIHADAKTDRVLGVHMIGPSVSELITEAVTVMEYGGSSEDIARTIHAHPTLSEVTKDAARAIAFK